MVLRTASGVDRAVNENFSFGAKNCGGRCSKPRGVRYSRVRTHGADAISLLTETRTLCPAGTDSFLAKVPGSPC